MSSSPLLVRRSRPALVVAVAALVCAGGLASVAPADAAPASAKVTSAALLTVEDVRSAGLVADTATVTLTGDAQLNDGNHYDENCLRDKTIRAITNAKSYPDSGTDKGYADGTWTSTLDKEVVVTESVAQGRTTSDTDRYVAALTDLTTGVQECQQDPAQGIRHAPVRHVDAGGAATADYYSTVYPDGSRDGGGVAVVRDGTRFGIVSVGSGRDHSAYTLKRLATSAANRLR